MMNAPAFDQTPMPPDQARKVANAFNTGNADHIPARALVRAGVAHYYPMRGGIFWRREPVSYLVVHSTETGIPLNAKRVIDSWTSMGRRHPGAQYVVDRDGTIYQAVDPDLATVHVNIFKTLPGINNDNSIGIEMVHTGRQTYTPEQRTSVIRLVHYLQDRYKVGDENVITHRYAQQGDHTDPVAFSWDGFLKDKSRFRNYAIAARMSRMVDEAETAWKAVPPSATTYLQIHTTLPCNPVLSASDERAPQLLQAADVRTSSAPTVAPALSDELRDPTAAEPGASPAKAGGNPGPAALPNLRGEIEVDPKTAGILLNAPVGAVETNPDEPAESASSGQTQAVVETASPAPAEAPASTQASSEPPAGLAPQAAGQAPAAVPCPGAEPVEHFIHQPEPADGIP